MGNWNLFRGGAGQQGWSPDRGPQRGRIAWKFPAGRQWYARPLLQNGKLYVVCPGRYSKLLCLDAASGESVWHTVAENPDDTEETDPGLPPMRSRMVSSPVLTGDSFWVRATRNRGLFRFGCADGRLLQTVDAGRMDCRVHPRPMLAGNGRYLLYPLGIADPATPVAKPQPTQSEPWQWMACRGAPSGDFRWAFKTGPYFSEPAVHGDLAYVGTVDGYFYCLEIGGKDEPAAKTSRNRIRWSFKLDAAINGSPYLAADRVIFGAEDGSVYCLNAADGWVLWRCETAPPASHAFIQFSAPTAASGRIYIGGASKVLHCLDEATGELLWTHEMPDWIRARPTATGQAVYAASLDGTVRALDLRDRSEPTVRWEAKIGQWHLSCDPVVSGSRLYLITSDLRVHCLSCGNGEPLWTRDMLEPPPDEVMGDEFQASPAVSGDSVYIGTPGRFCFSVDNNTGAEQWRHETGGEIPSDPICVNGRVYFGQYGGTGEYFCLDASDGRVIWTQNLGWIWSAANCAEGRLYVPGMDGTAWCLDAESGAVLWSFRVGSDLYYAPAIHENLVYFGSWDHWLYALDRASGRVVWAFDAECYLDSGAPAVSQGRLYVPTMGPWFYCLEAATGKPIWKFQPEGIWSTNTSPALWDRYVLLATFNCGDRPAWRLPYDITTWCLDKYTGEVIWRFPAGGLNGPVIAEGRAYFGSTEQGVHTYYCADLEGNGDGTTSCLWECEIGGTVLESCTAISERRAYVLAEDGYLYAFE